MTTETTRLPKWFQEFSREVTGGPTMSFEEWQTKTTEQIGIPSLGMCGGTPERFQRDHFDMGTTPEVFAYYVLLTVQKRTKESDTP